MTSRFEIFFFVLMKLPSGEEGMILGPRNLVGTSELAKDETNEAQNQMKLK